MGRHEWGIAGIGLVMLATAGCGSDAADSSAPGELIGYGTVIESGPGSQEPLLCLSDVLESAPPQCAGNPVTLHGLDWAALPEVSETSGTRWFDGTFYGTWDGFALTLTRPFAVGDQTGIDQQSSATSSAGSADPQTIAVALEKLRTRLPEDLNYLAAAEFDRNVHLTVVYDDGTIQANLDRELGAGVVLVRSALYEP